MRWRWFSWLILVPSLLYLLIFAYCAFADHLAWMMPYRSASGYPCCGHTDCVHANVAVEFLVEETQRLVTVNGVRFLLPAASIHHSEDGVGYWCHRPGTRYEVPSEHNTTCIFFTEGT